MLNPGKWYPIFIRYHLEADTSIILSGRQFLGGEIYDWANWSPAHVPTAPPPSLESGSPGLMGCFAGSHVGGAILCKQSCVGFSTTSRKGKPTSQLRVHLSQDESQVTLHQVVGVYPEAQHWSIAGRLDIGQWQWSVFVSGPSCSWAPAFLPPWLCCSCDPCLSIVVSEVG